MSSCTHSWGKASLASSFPKPWVELDFEGWESGCPLFLLERVHNHLRAPPQTLSLFLLPRFVMMGQLPSPCSPNLPSYFPKEIKNTESAQYCSYCGTGWCWAKVLN